MKRVLGLVFAVIGMRIFLWEALPPGLRGSGAVIAVLGVCLIGVGVWEWATGRRAGEIESRAPDFVTTLRSGSLLGKGEVWLTSTHFILKGKVSPPGTAFGLEPLYPERLQDAVIKPDLFRRLESEIDDAIAAEFIRPIRRTLPFAKLPDPASLVINTTHPNEFTVRIPETAPGDLPVTMTFAPNAGAEFLAALTAAWNGASHIAHA